MHTIVLYAKMETSCLVIQDVLTVRVGALTLSSVSELAKKRSESPCFYTVGYSSITMPFAGTMCVSPMICWSLLPSLCTIWNLGALFGLNFTWEEMIDNDGTCMTKPLLSFRVACICTR